jgi:RAD3-like DEAD/DEAH box helicase/type III restriction/modification enzyme restriction subunit
MALDLSRLVAPIKGTRFSVLRRAQEAVLRDYASEAHTLSDIAIELPTGAGKTLIALLVLDYWRNQSKRVAVLTGNKTLARQLEAEGTDLRVPIVRFEGRGDQLAPKDLRLYNRSQAIAVMNYWVYINQNPAVEPAEVLVLDDAQLAEGALLSLYSVRIGRFEHADLYRATMELCSQYTNSPVADDFQKGIDPGPWGSTDLIPFVQLVEMHDELEALVQAHLAQHADDPAWTDLRFQWNRLRRNLRQALFFLNSDEVVLRPYIFPTQQLDHLASPMQRIFMSATLHDPEDLRRRLGTPPIVKLNIPAELAREEDGRRLFIFNQTASPSARNEPTDEVIIPLRELLRVKRKSVWLCSSGREARSWCNWLQEQFGGPDKTPPTWELTSTGQELETFCAAAEGHLFIAGRFEGMDFPGETCRIAVLPSLPRATGALERFVTEQLRDARFQKTRMIERIKQGIGRCTRGRDDYAVYYMLDTRFYAEMESKPFAALVSERARRQIELGLELTQDGFGTVLPFATEFLKGKRGEFERREEAVRPPPAVAAAASPSSRTVSDEVDGWKALYGTRDFTTAARCFEKVSRNLADAEREHRGFWKYMEAHSEYLRHLLDGQGGALDACINHLEQAVEEGGSSSWFNRLRLVLNKLKGSRGLPAEIDFSTVFDKWDDLAERYPFYKGRFLKWQAGVKAYLDGTHNQVCDALQILGHVLGYQASRPDGQGSADGVWVSGDHAVTLEAKIDVARDRVSLADVNQANGHRRSTSAALGFPEVQVRPVVVTTMGEIDDSATRALGEVRILRLDLIVELQARLERTMRVYWKGWSRDDASARARLRRAVARMLPRPDWLPRALERTKTAFIEEHALFGEWPKQKAE